MAMFSAPLTATAVTAAVDIFEITAPTNEIVIIHEVRIGQTTETGDAQEEFLQIQFKRGTSLTTSGSGGSTITPAKLMTGTAAANSVVEALNTTKMAVGTGTITTTLADAWSVRGGFLYLPTPECRIILAPGERMTVELVAAPADSITVVANLTFEEMG